jgi:predicted HTH transcriptional regulator
MYSITELEQEQRDALNYWINDLSKDKEPLIICDPHYYLSKSLKTEDLLFMDIPQETRRESYEAVKPDATARRRVILEILAEKGSMTAREVSGELHRRGITPTDERNYAAPRLTELYKAGKITTTGKKPCPQTGRNVAVWAVRG